ncbi:hypothetical protein ALC57_05098 [Trachymyrmex cornetzi]|uniref:Uncharacterized protein n=1 Tax=Trachymyrmex cornetzi TaxID=471704 RepID=A0A151JBG6_9HYME|nr:hypothetical protein ALC57_05098 [Trachymyrmex cornetzi]
MTGVVLNSSYIEPRQFLDDVRDIVIDRIRDNLQRHNCLKVNTIFNGEFVADAKRSAKSITTKNYELFNTSDLRECKLTTTRERPPGKRNVKLLATLYNKERYVVYYRNLQQYIHHDLHITKIYRILQFAQSPWLCRSTLHEVYTVSELKLALKKQQFYQFNEFMRTVTKAGKFNINILNVECSRNGLLQQIQDILSRLLRSSIT